MDPVFIGLAVALGVGLLIGVERERSKGVGPSRGPAGVRTFAIVALAGALAMIVGGETLLGVVTLGVIGLAALAYWRTPDPGLTTEMALVVACLLGGLAMRAPVLAGGAGAAVAILLAARVPLHRFVRRALTRNELRDMLIFAAATLIVLPLLPNRPVGPFGVLNPQKLWIVVVLVMAISAAGHVALRSLGARLGLPVAGFVSGFISSAATIGAMGAKAVKAPGLRVAAAAGAALSTVATIVLLSLILMAISPEVLKAMALPLGLSGSVAGAYGLALTARAAKQQAEPDVNKAAALSLPSAVLFGLTLAGVLLAAAVAREYFGEAGVFAAAAIAGIADAHSASTSVASLAASGKLAAGDAVWPILAALSTNTVSKAVMAITMGDRGFALRVLPGLVLVVAAAWAGALL